MAINDNDRYVAAIVVNWLRKCQEDEAVACQCRKCPFTGVKCISHIQSKAAELLQRFSEDASNANKKNPRTGFAVAEIIAGLRNCSEKSRTDDRCAQCPFEDGEHNCMDWLHSLAADSLEQLIKVRG